MNCHIAPETVRARGRCHIATYPSPRFFAGRVKAIIAGVVQLLAAVDEALYVRMEALFGLDLLFDAQDRATTAKDAYGDNLALHRFDIYIREHLTRIEWIGNRIRFSNRCHFGC